MNTTSKKLEGKVAIITGAARGQGADEARRFVAEGARVVLTDLLPSGADLAAELGSAAIFIQHDVANEAQWRSVVDTALEKFGRIDILVNNAGIFTPAMLEDTTAESFDRHYRVTQYGPFLGMKAVLAPM